MIDLIFVMGPTCVGKSSMISTFLESPVLGPHTRAVEVGKMLRAKYPPEYFEGLNNPTHTANEAWDLCIRGVLKAEGEEARVILVDGQPRDIPQVTKCLMFDPNRFKLHFWLLDAPFAERERRARTYRKGADLETLAIPRLKNDILSNYGVLVDLVRRQVDVRIIDTGNPSGLRRRDLFGGLISELEVRHGL